MGLHAAEKKHQTEYKTLYRHYSDLVKKELGTQSQSSHWVLMTRDVIPDSRNKSYKDQKALMRSYAEKTGQPYELPTALEAATCILMEHVKSGQRFYSDNPLTYTRCQESVDQGRWVATGGFAAAGLGVHSSYWVSVHDGLGGLRKLVIGP